MATGLVWHERYAWHDGGQLPLGPFGEPWPGPDTPETKRRIYGLLEASGLAEQLLRIPPQPAGEADLLRFHQRAYVDRVKAASDAGGGFVGENAWIGQHGFDIARLAVGGCMAALDAVLRGAVDNAYALVRPAGHHAEAGQGRGFCIFANVALAVLHAKATHGIGRIAVLDWDVHHGNGTEDAFYADPSVLTISLHQAGNYPPDRGEVDAIGEGAGRGTNLNLPLPPGSGHGAYLAAMEQVVLPALRAFRPELLVVASGYDASARDPMGRMLCHSETFRAMTGMIKAAAAELCAGRLVVCQEGGYWPTYTPFCALAVLETLAGVRTEVVDPLAERFARLPGQELRPDQAAVIEAVAARRAGCPG